MYKSLETFLKKYPFFLDKRSDSNFTKTKRIFNNRVQDLNNDIFKVYLAGKLLKHVLVWKVQLDPYVYEMYFHASFDNIKSVRIIKNYTLESTHEV